MWHSIVMNRHKIRVRLQWVILTWAFLLQLTPLFVKDHDFQETCRHNSIFALLIALYGKPQPKQSG